MAAQARAKKPVFAVIRFDAALTDVEDAVTITEILPSHEEASAEAERLNALNGGKNCRYFWQQTRYYPDGRRA